MINVRTGSIIRNSLRELQIQKCHLHVNTIHVERLQRSPALHSVNGLFKNQEKIKCSFLSNTSFTETPSIRQVSRIPGKNRSVFHRDFPVLRNGIYSRNVLFANSCLHVPTKLNVRYQSTISEVVDETSTTEISEQLDKSWFSSGTEGVEYLLKDVSESALATIFQTLLENVHSITGLPWWGTIILTTLTLRTVLILPFAVQQRHILVKLENAQREMEDIMYYIKKEISMSVKKFGWPVEFARVKYREKVKEEWKTIYNKENAHPLKACSVVLIQSSTWMGMSLAIANMCCAFPHNDPVKEHLYSEMTTGGFGLMNNLAVADSSLILPVSLGLLNLSIIGVNCLILKDKNIVQKITFGTLSLVSLGMIPVAMEMPSGLVLYWATSSGYGLIFNSLLAISAVRKVLRIPQVKSDVDRKQDVAEMMTARQNSENTVEELTEGENITKKSKGT